MKISIAYRAPEEAETEALTSAIKELMPRAKIKHSERHQPFKHVYITVGDRDPQKPSE